MWIIGINRLVINVWQPQTHIPLCSLKKRRTFSYLSHFDKGINSIFLKPSNGDQEEVLWHFSICEKLICYSFLNAFTGLPFAAYRDSTLTVCKDFVSKTFKPFIHSNPCKWYGDYKRDTQHDSGVNAVSMSTSVPLRVYWNPKRYAVF